LIPQELARKEKLTVTLSSPDMIMSESRGEVTKPETINYRSYKPEKDGLFCEKIFGPVKDWECHCGKYKGRRYKGIVCDRCGVEITKKEVRRERMGHLTLAVPVVHIWFFRSLPTKIGYFLGMTVKHLERVIYYESFAVIQPGVSKFKHSQVVTEEEIFEFHEQNPGNRDLPNEDPDKLITGIGAECVKTLLATTDVDALSHQLRIQVKTESSVQRKTEALKRLKVIEAFKKRSAETGDFINRPEWMVMDVVPVIPPDLRPLVPLEGGRFATSDLNDLYRRVIIRNNRLKRLIEIKAPEVILRNEKRMLQEAVDSLFDNGRKSTAVRSDGNRPLKSLSDVLKGKQGRFRQNLLGKRVDYSGRSVITVGPDLLLHQCGLPKYMAVELFKPFIIRRLLDTMKAPTVKKAKKIIEEGPAFVWEILEEIVKGHPVMLNRAPTLHRLGIQAFQPLLVEGKSIQLHPLVCTAFNADFDGDQMAVHLPLSFEAQLEAKYLMMANQNILHPASGRPITVPSQDMVLGCYYMTKFRAGEPNEGRRISCMEELRAALDHKVINLHTMINMRMQNGKMLETTAGRVLFNEIMPAEIQGQHFFNEVMTKRNLEKVIFDIFHLVGLREAAAFLDNLKTMGFANATKSGASIGLSNILIPEAKNEIISHAQEEVDGIQEAFQNGFMRDGERYNKVIDTWSQATIRVAKRLMNTLKADEGGFNPLFMMADSGARGSNDQIKQLAGMRGLMAKPQKRMTGGKGEIIESPITANFKEGLSVLEYFISTHGARKGLADTALKTADAGYLTRRLVDVAQDVIVREHDCGTIMGIDIAALKEGEEVTEHLHDRILGRVLAEDLIDPITEELIAEGNMMVDEELATNISQHVIDKVKIRSVLTCELESGCCALCYGRNLTTNTLVNVGEAVGVMAAQSIGEPGTQLTLRTFHIGGAASLESKEAEIKSRFDGKIHFENMHTELREDGVEITTRRNGQISIFDANGRPLARYSVPYGAHLAVKHGKKIKTGDLVYEWDPHNVAVLAPETGVVEFKDLIPEVTYREEVDEVSEKKSMVIIDSRSRKINPHLLINDAKTGEVLADLVPPVGSHLLVKEGEIISKGMAIVKKPREMSKNKDITGGLPRVAELFEARKPKDPAVITEISGPVHFGAVKTGYREVTVEPEFGDNRTYKVPLAKHIEVHDGEYVEVGERLSEGNVVPQDILKILGPMRVQEYLVEEIQDVYRFQGVKINDKHIEVIVRQMMQKVRITEPGDTQYLEGDLVDGTKFKRLNQEIHNKVVVEEPGSSVFHLGEVISREKLADELTRVRTEVRSGAELTEPLTRPAQPAIFEPVLMGITQAALNTDSFISAASFQETTRVLADAAIHAKSDSLVGLKENVIMGYKIPAGTGLRKYEMLHVEDPYMRQRETEREAELAIIAAEEAKLAAEAAEAAEDEI
jgi:DNA-directed RNA polymerase subunit beta'